MVASAIKVLDVIVFIKLCIWKFKSSITKMSAPYIARFYLVVDNNYSIKIYIMYLNKVN